MQKIRINWRYAIGEIIIVIIGITLAFWLNNWKEYQNGQSQKKQYLENLIMDIEQEMDQLKENQVQVNNKLKLIGEIKTHLGTQKSGRDSIVMKVFELARLINFYPESTTYQTLINSGDMQLIDNFELRRSLEKHYALHKNISKDYERIEKIHEKYLGDFFINHIDYKKLRNGDMEFLDNPLINNIITSIEGAYYLVIKGNKVGITSNEELLKQINAEV